ncbi:MAG: PDZ domain-containing protein [Candidatus Eiseniibacteriota bacterium]
MTPRKILLIACLAAMSTTPVAAQAHDDDEPVRGESEAGTGWLGIRPQRIEGGLAEALNLESDSGVLVGQVVEDSPAEKAGLRAGDIVLSVDRKEVGTPSELVDAVRDREAGESVSVSILRDGKTREIDVKLGEAPTFGERLEDGSRAGLHDLRRRLDRVRDLRVPGKHGFLGVVTQPVDGGLAEYFGAAEGGALVSEVVEDSPAEKLGLRAGDVIVEVAGEEVTDPGDLRRAVAKHEDGEDEVEVAWIRAKQRQSGRVALEMREGPRFFSWTEDGGGPVWEHAVPPDPEALDDLRRHAGDARVRVERFYDESEMDDMLRQLRKELDELREEVEELKSSN